MLTYLNSMGIESDDSGNQHFPTNGFRDKPVFIYKGSVDPTIGSGCVEDTADWYEDQGAIVDRIWVENFGHNLPNDIPN